MPSFFHQNKNPSLLIKRSTFSSKSVAEAPVPTLTRSKTTLSKVKRFGSLLSRNKKTYAEERRRVDTIFPSPIDTSLASSYSLSSSPTNTHLSSSDEDDLVTPTTTPNRTPMNMTFDEEEVTIFNVVTPTVMDDEVKIMSVTPQIQANQVEDDMDIIKHDYEQDAQELPPSSLLNKQDVTQSTSDQIDPSALSGVSLVRYHLGKALEEVDEEIEQELESCRLQMLQSLNIISPIAFY